MPALRQPMHLILVTFGSVFLLPGQYKPANSQFSTRFRLEVRLAHERVAADEPVEISTTLKNISRAPATFAETMDEWDYDFIVTDMSGHAPPRTAYGQRLARAERGGRRIGRTLDPDAEVHRKFDLRSIFVFARGRYCLRALRFVSSEDGKTPSVALSNAACFEVTK